VRATCQLIRRFAARTPVTIVTEGSNSLFATALAHGGFDVRLVHVITSSQWRRHYEISGHKSDKTDAMVLAQYGRIQGESAHRLPKGSDLAGSIRVLARAHEEMAHRRHGLSMQLRASLLEYYPQAVQAFPVLYRPTTLIALHLAPTSTAARRLSTYVLLRALREGGIHASLNQATARLDLLRSPALRRTRATELAHGESTRAMCGLIGAVGESMRRLETQMAAALDSHPCVETYRSFPGLGTVLTARLLGEIGDDPERFPSARHLCAYAGVAPVTRSSGTQSRTRRRLVCNRRLAANLHAWTLPLVNNSPAARAYYDARRAHGDGHGTASRNLMHRYLRILHHCLRTGQSYKEEVVAAVVSRAADQSGPTTDDG
jgi:transposase